MASSEPLEQEVEWIRGVAFRCEALRRSADVQEDARFSEVGVVPVDEAKPEVVVDAGLVVVGGPTQAHGMSHTSTRSSAIAAVDLNLERSPGP